MGSQLREKQAIGFGAIGQGLQNAGNFIGETAKGYGHQWNSFYNPWSKAFHEPAGPHASDNIIRNVGRGAATAALGAGGGLAAIGAAPAVASTVGAVNTAGNTVAAGLAGAGVLPHIQRAVNTVQGMAPRLDRTLQSVTNNANKAVSAVNQFRQPAAPTAVAQAPKAQAPNTSFASMR
jgi:hypothetical protein